MAKKSDGQTKKTIELLRLLEKQYDRLSSYGYLYSGHDNAVMQIKNAKYKKYGTGRLPYTGKQKLESVYRGPSFCYQLSK